MKNICPRRIAHDPTDECPECELTATTTITVVTRFRGAVSSRQYHLTVGDTLRIFNNGTIEILFEGPGEMFVGYGSEHEFANGLYRRNTVPLRIGEKREIGPWSYVGVWYANL